MTYSNIASNTLLIDYMSVLFMLAYYKVESWGGFQYHGVPSVMKVKLFKIYC
jgi:hypothetical protein